MRSREVESPGGGIEHIPARTSWGRFCAGWRLVSSLLLQIISFIAHYINSIYDTDGRRVIPKKPSETGRQDRPVRLQNVWLFSYCVSFFKNGWFK